MNPVHTPGRPPAWLDPIDRRIVNALQKGLPLTPHPYADAARSLGIVEAELLKRLHALLARGVLTRFGPLFQIEQAGGQFVLCACHAPAHRLEAVIAAINAFPEVAHHYERTHHLNLWFVVAVANKSDVPDTLVRIAARADIDILPFPKKREFFVNLYLPV
ncbi:MULTISPECIES: Lrp/AsnC family transcriptional regulator [unclassified Cupriavidus]|uniref:Lrp/AsnC family transcriptional regulator n=1 Tax=unclassified Cupriavidus TaxID=2640874 RepID=UPI001365401E|nr:Lrp/AsnC family transcriptional regulator [Cupriavidus sp. SW-Y-13]MWL88547.1 AsnC family transcriptional regulator [Cupriavidus sp. SW-Y-13]